MPSVRKTIWFIRHGQSISNAGLPTQTPGSPPLTKLGMKQAQRVAAFFSEAPELIVSSPYVRSQETAVPTRERFPHVPHEEWRVQEFTYLDPSQYAGTTTHERRAPVEVYWRQADPHLIDGEGAESFVEMIGRVDEMLHRIRLHAAGTIAVFTHGIFMRAFLWRWLQGSAERAVEHMAAFRTFLLSVSTPNGCIIESRFAADGHLHLSPIMTDHIPPDLKS